LFSGGRAKNGGVLEFLISPEIFCSRADEFSCPPPLTGEQFVMTDLFSWICGLNSVKQFQKFVPVLILEPCTNGSIHSHEPHVVQGSELWTIIKFIIQRLIKKLEKYLMLMV
jgi:hypothetical protein